MDNLGLHNSLKERLIRPFWNYRGSEHGPGLPVSFATFMRERPDGGEIIRNRRNQPIGWDDLFADMGLDPFQLTLNGLASRDDDFALLFGPAIEDAFIEGFITTRDGRPALWSELCFATGVPVGQEGIRRTRLHFSGVPLPTAEGENFPEAKILLDQEEFHWKKKGLTLRLTNEYLRSNPLAVVEAWIAEVGRVYQHLENAECVRALLNGDLSGGNEAPIVGVSSTDVGIDYTDFARAWTRGNLIGEIWWTVVAGEGMGNMISNIDEFKVRQAGTPLVSIVTRPEPANMARHISAEVPENQLLLVDTTHAVRQRVFIPIHVKEADHPENWTRGITIGYSSCFERIGDKACVVVDQSLDFTSNGFPSWFTVGGSRPY